VCAGKRARGVSNGREAVEWRTESGRAESGEWKNGWRGYAELRTTKKGKEARGEKAREKGKEEGREKGGGVKREGGVGWEEGRNVPLALGKKVALMCATCAG
jgi:hypothetical protein